MNYSDLFPVIIVNPEDREDIWVDPDGICYGHIERIRFPHDLLADALCLKVFRKPSCWFGNNSDYLIACGWIKLTCSELSKYYILDGLYKHMTDAQKETKKKYDDFHTKGKMQYAKGSVKEHSPFDR